MKKKKKLFFDCLYHKKLYIVSFSTCTVSFSGYFYHVSKILHGLQINSIKHAIYALTYNLQFFYCVIVQTYKNLFGRLAKNYLSKEDKTAWSV